MRPVCCRGISTKIAEQTKAVMTGLPIALPDLLLHPLRRSCRVARFAALDRLGPNDAVVPFAQQIADAIQPLMVRFRRDVGSLFTFIKASAHPSPGAAANRCPRPGGGDHR